MRWTGRVRRVLVVVLAVSLAVVGPASGVVAGGVQAVEPSGDQFQQSTPTPTNNTTRHENPDEISEDGDLDEVRRWLAGRMAVELEECAVEIGLGETDVCELEDDYPEWLNKYVDVAEETSTEEDDRQAETFEEAAEETRDLANQTDEFEETRQAYEDAREAGDETEARQHARDLLRQGEDINATADRLVERYTAIERGSGVELGEAKESVNRTAENVTAVVAEVETELFVTTALSAEISPREISFLAPGNVTGRLVTENGSPVSNESIRLEVGGRVLGTETNATGAFSVAYRPTTVPVETSRLPVRYVPSNASVYLGSSATLDVSITQVEPTVSVEISPTDAGFGDTVRITGTVGADEVSAAEVPVAVTLDGRSAGTVQTNADGQFTITADVGAFDGPGEVAVRAAMPLEDRALAATADESALTIERTATNLTISSEADGPRAVTVAGTIRTADGDPVPGRQIRLRVNGTSVETVRTGRDGRFRTAVTVPTDLLQGDADTNVQVAAAFDGAGTNLEGSEDRAVVVLPAAGGPPGDGSVLERLVELLSNPIWLGIGAVGVLILLGLLYLGWRRYPFGGPTDAEMGPPPEPSGEPDTGAAATADETTTDVGPLARARERLGSDADDAVMLAYAAVRQSLATAVAPASREADTHWEFLAACRQDGLDESAIDSLTQLTEAYEQAAYAPVAVDRANAESVLEAAEPLVEAAD